MFLCNMSVCVLGCSRRAVKFNLHDARYLALIANSRSKFEKCVFEHVAT